MHSYCCKLKMVWFPYQVFMGGSTYRKVTFMFILSHRLQGRLKLGRAGRNLSLPALLGKCLQKLMLSPVVCIFCVIVTRCVWVGTCQNLTTSKGQICLLRTW